MSARNWPLVLLLALLGAAPLRAGDDDTAPLPPLRALDPADLDRGADPCKDIWRFANGGWLDRNPIPPDEASFGVAHEVRDRNRQVLHSLLVADAARRDAPPGSNDALLGDFWCACMDTDAIERQGIVPISDMLGRIGSIADVDDLRYVLVFAQLQGLPLVYALQPDQAADDATQLVLWAWQDGLGLPDPEAYTRPDARSQQLREEYVGHVAAMLALLGEPPEQAASDAATVMQIETALAEHSMTAVQQRDPHATWNPVTPTEADLLCPGLHWTETLGRLGAGGVKRFSLAQPEFFKALAALMTSVPLAEWQTYLRWRVVNAAAPTLARVFDDEDFRFNGRVLSGAESRPPRWKRCLRATDAALGMALGQAFVAASFPPQAAERAEALVHDVKQAMRARLAAADWMSADTRRQALEKLDALVEKLGRPASWRDYSALRFVRDGYASNVVAAAAFEVRRQLQRLHHPVDRSEWLVPPQIVDAYYNPSLNEIVLPAGILQPPFFGAGQDDAANYGAIGAAIGHEITHAFDDAGAQYDKDGNLRDWWTEQDLDEFRRRGAALAQQFDALIGVDELHVDGQLTLGENIADLGGLSIAYDAFRATQAGRSQAPDASGFTPDQRFFLAYVQSWRAAQRPEALRVQLRTDPHAPDRLRATVPLQDLPAFGAAFGCTPADASVGVW